MNEDKELQEIIYRNWKNGDEVGLFSEVSGHIKALLTKLRGEIEGVIKYNLEELREMNKHLDSRTYQSTLDTSAGIIQHNKEVVALIDKYLKENEN